MKWTAEEIRSLLPIDRSAGKLAEQLRRALQCVIDRSAAGTPIPPQRETAEALGISRITVRNAMADFFAAGSLEQSGRSGTRVAPKSTNIAPCGQAATREAMPLPFLPPPTRCLTVRIFEQFPAQKAFWHQVVDSFNQSQQDIFLTIRAGKARVTDDSDLFQCSFLDSELGDSAPLPEHFVARQRALLAEGGSFSDPVAGHLLGRMAPAIIYMPYTHCNLDLADRIGMERIPERIRAGEYIQVLEEAVTRLDHDDTAEGHIWDILQLRPTADNFSREDLASYLQMLEPLRFKENAFFLTQTHSFDAVEAFHAGRQLLLSCGSIRLQPYDSCPFRMGREAFKACAEDTMVELWASAFAVNSCSLYRQEAIEFLEYVQSDEVQNLPCSFALPLRHPHSGRVNCDTHCMRHHLKNFLIYSIRSELRDMMQGQLSVAGATDRIWRAWQNELQGKGVL